MDLYKNVNGVKVKLTSEEIEARLAEEELAAKQQELEVPKRLMLSNISKGKRIKDRIMELIALKQLTSDELIKLSSEYMGLSFLLDNGAVETALGIVNSMQGNKIVTSKDLEGIKSIFAKELGL